MTIHTQFPSIIKNLKLKYTSGIKKEISSASWSSHSEIGYQRCTEADQINRYTRWIDGRRKQNIVKPPIVIPYCQVKTEPLYGDPMHWNIKDRMYTIEIISPTNTIQSVLSNSCQGMAIVACNCYYCDSNLLKLDINSDLLVISQAWSLKHDHKKWNCPLSILPCSWFQHQTVREEKKTASF
jgi:hypothetical protein